MFMYTAKLPAYRHAVQHAVHDTCDEHQTAQMINMQHEHDMQTCSLTFWSFLDTTSCRKSAVPLRSGQQKPRLAKYCRVCSTGPWYTM